MPGARARHFADRTTEDVFALVLRYPDATFDAGGAWHLLLDSGATEVTFTEVAR
jgi:hypothetical protein